MNKSIIPIFVLGILFLLTQAVSAGQLTFEWDPPATGGSADGYHVYWSTVSKSYSIKNSVDVGDSDHDTIDGLISGKKYYFIIRAYNAAGEGPYSNEVSATVPYQYVLEDGMGPGVWIRVSGSGSWTSAPQPDEDIATIFSSTGVSTLSTFKLSASAVGSSFKSLRWVYNYFQSTNSYFLVNVSTSKGTRNMIYKPIATSALGSSTNIYFGIGTTVKDGTWRVITRNLQNDLSTAQPGNILTKINYFTIYAYGSGKAIGIKEIIAQHN